MTDAERLDWLFEHCLFKVRGRCFLRVDLPDPGEHKTGRQVLDEQMAAPDPHTAADAYDFT